MARQSPKRSCTAVEVAFWATFLAAFPIPLASVRCSASPDKVNSLVAARALLVPWDRLSLLE